MKDKDKQINVSTKEEIEARNKTGKEKDELRQALLHYATAEATNGIKTLIDCEGCTFYLYEMLGYRKIDKNSVVLSREEYEKVKHVLKYEPEEAIIRLEDLTKNERLYSPHMFCSLGGCSGVRKGCNRTCKESWIVIERKETAEKFYDKICTNTCVFTTPPNVSEDYNKGYVQAMVDHSERIDQVAKQFGVEIDNNVEHKEITTEELLEMGKKRNELKLAEKITVSNNKDSVEIKE